jgi:hypothetical protein
MKTFLVTGYPRSRTAWVSQFLTYGPSFCFHEPNVMFGISRYPSLFEIAATEFVGVAEARAVFFYQRFMDLFPETRVAVIKRDRQEVIDSLTRQGFDFSGMVDEYETRLKEIEKNALVLPFDNLNAQALWEHCIPDYPVNKIRLRMLERYQIQLLPEQIKHRYTLF